MQTKATIRSNGRRTYSQALRDALQEHGIQDRIARRRVDSSEKLSCHRWVVERPHSWLNGFRCLKMRYERKAQIKRNRGW